MSVAALALVSRLGAVSSSQAAVVKQTLSLSAPSWAVTGLAFTLSRYGVGPRKHQHQSWIRRSKTSSQVTTPSRGDRRGQTLEYRARSCLRGATRFSLITIQGTTAWFSA